LVDGDVGDPEAMAEAVERYGVDSVIHFAAHKSSGESTSKPQPYFANNVARSTKVLES
jgi:UDP-glucose 4-epimerase